MERMEHNSSVVMWWSPHNSSSIQQMLLGITAVQVTTLWLDWSITVMHYTVNKYIDASEHNRNVSFNDYHSVVCHPSVSAFLICHTHRQTIHTYRVASPYLLRKHSYTQISCSPSAIQKSITACLKCTPNSAVLNQMWCCHLSKRPQLL